MKLSTELDQLFVYEHWGNRELLESLRQATPPPQKALSLLAHILAAQQLWLDRLTGTPQSLPVWPELSVTEIAALLDSLRDRWDRYLGDSDRLPADVPVTYTNSKGESFRSRPSEILTHVFMHGAYHRGQIALILRQSGLTPPYTDYIHAIRTGAIGT